MSAKQQKDDQYDEVEGSPVKSFFVSMLTRDIELEDAILDLLDNSVDGILRLKHKGSKEKPYEGFWARINFNKDGFKITDNCGGIPWKLHNYAFRMGREAGQSDVDGTVGVYGIGMKRAIFKMGEDCSIWTQNRGQGYKVDISPEWIHDEGRWKIPVSRSKKTMKSDGTEIAVKELYPGIAEQFGKSAEAFTSGLEHVIGTHYAFIIDKGFDVKINGQAVKPQPTRLVFTKPSVKRRPAIRPFVFKTITDDGVHVFLAVGFTRPIPSEEEAISEQEETRYSSLDAGWTVVCNDRAVVYCDRSELTGWGEAGVPRYHNQFIAISGIVEFRSADPSKLPTTTTKRGIDASSPLYLQVKNKMREGMLLFVDYTNKWKGRAEESKKHIEAGEALLLSELKDATSSLNMTTTRQTVPKGQQYKPPLPKPETFSARKRRISYVKDLKEVQQVGEYLFDDPESDPSKVGAECFDLILRKANK